MQTFRLLRADDFSLCKWMNFLRLGLLVAASLLLLAQPAPAQLERALEAHGGLAKWRSFAGVEYDLTWKSAKRTLADHQLFDLQSRAGLITSEKYTLGTSGGKVWIKPGLDALAGTPPRFYMTTPFYFFGMPFVFADAGTKEESLGKKTFRGQEYDVVKITYAKGTGDSPDDFYVADIDPATAHLKLVYYIVTDPAIRKDRPVAELEPHAIVFEEWQTVDGLLVPKVAPFYNWTGSDIEGEPLGRLEFSAVKFTTEAPAPAKFQKPADAVAAPL
ncbi:hypothetical protein BH18VER2_BH18VER2_15300 [soil metagenome]